MILSRNIVENLIPLWENIYLFIYNEIVLFHIEKENISNIAIFKIGIKEG